MGRPAKLANKPGKRVPGAFKAVLTRLNGDGWRALRLLAAERDTTLNALAVEAFNDLLRKYGKRATVENPLLPDQD
jgi:hypothetical protein